MSRWQNRIVGHGEEDPAQLLANPRNFRIHPKTQQDAVAGVLEEVGWVQSVIVNRTTGHLIDGHLRVSIALRDDEPTIPVVYVDLSEAEEALILATLDPLAALAGTDREKLAELLAEVTTDSAALQQVLSDMAINSGSEPADFSDLANLLPSDQERIVTMKFTITEAQRETINHALDVAKEDAKGGESPNDMGNRLHAICVAYGQR
jgi:ParB-like chromosome segregation protein Spo0J